MVQLKNVGVIRKNQNGNQSVILDGISFVACQGETTGIVGPSESGKSTLLRLINRLDDPSGGTISLSGEDISKIEPLALRRRVAMVQQEPFMFEGTVLANLQRPFLYRKLMLLAMTGFSLQVTGTRINKRLPHFYRVVGSSIIIG